jgi:hypothetical protein
MSEHERRKEDVDKWWERPPDYRYNWKDNISAVWPIIASVILVAVTWGMMHADTNNLKDALSTISVKVDGVEPRLSRVEQAVIDIKDILKEMRERRRE